MIALLFFLAQIAPQESVPREVVPREIVPMPPADWSALPLLHFRKTPDIADDLSTFVRGEVKAGRCQHATRTAKGWSMKVDVAVLGTSAGQAKRVVPRAIDCPTVEQYASGLVSRMARDNVDAAAGGDAWYRISMAFAWDE